MGGYTYMQFIVPGLVMMSVIQNSYGNISSSFFGAKFGRHVEEAAGQPDAELGDPVGLRGRRRAARPDGGRDRADHRDVLHPGAHPAPAGDADHGDPATIFSPGFINAVYAKKFDDVAIVPTFILTPLTYLGGVFYSVKLLPGWAEAATHAEPDLLHGQRVPLWPAGQQRCAAAGGLRPDDRFRGADGAGAVAAAPWRGHAQLSLPAGPRCTC
jgi:ABC-2 type transport system permease protein